MSIDAKLRSTASISRMTDGTKYLVVFTPAFPLQAQPPLGAICGDANYVSERLVELRGMNREYLLGLDFKSFEDFEQLSPLLRSEAAAYAAQ